MTQLPIGVDCETWLIRPGQQAPRLVSVAFGSASEAPRLYHREDRDGWIPELIHALRNRPIVGHNIAFDFGVLLNECRRLHLDRQLSEAGFREICDLVWGAYDAGRVADSMIDAILCAIAAGEPVTIDARKKRGLPMFSLGAQVAAVLGQQVVGKDGDSWRMRYSELDQVPICDWPAEADDYARLDTVYTDQLSTAIRARTRGEMPGTGRTVRAAWGLHLGGCWGVRTDPAYVDAIGAYVARRTARAADVVHQFAHWIRPDGTRDMERQRARVAAALVHVGQRPDAAEHMTAGTKKTPPKQSTSRDTLLACAVQRGDFDDCDHSWGAAAAGGYQCSSCGSLTLAPDLIAYAQTGADRTDDTTFMPQLRSACVLPANARYFPCVESERISCADPNLTNQPNRLITISPADVIPQIATLAQLLIATGRKPKIGVRSCYVPRPGFVYSFCDYSTAELRAFAQVCLWLFGRSVMAETLHAEARSRAAGLPSLDLHERFGAKILRVSDQEWIRLRDAKDPIIPIVRQLAKRWNFGRLGGMGQAVALATAERDGFDLTLGGRLGNDARQVVADLDPIWLDTWPEVPEYFGFIKQQLRRGGGSTFVARSFNGGIVRGGVGYKDGANHFFQNLVAQWIKESIYLLQRAGFNDPGDPFYGSRVVIAPHDETGAEVPIYKAHEAATRQAEIMISVAARICPDVPHAAEPALCDRWHKGAKPVHDSAGRLQVWQPLA